MTALAIDRGLTELDSWAADPVGFDLNSTDPRFIDNPFPTYARLRREVSSASQSRWHLFRNPL